MSTPTLLTFSQAAQRLGVDVNLIRRWVRTEQCPVVVDGRKRRIPAEWVDAQPEAAVYPNVSRQ